LVSWLQSDFDCRQKDILTASHWQFQFFFGTPHRASDDFPWETTLSNLLCRHSPRVSDVSTFRAVQYLAAANKELLAQFEVLSRRYTFKVVNYYQSPPSCDGSNVVSTTIFAETRYDIDCNQLLQVPVVSRFAATLGWLDREWQVVDEKSHDKLGNMSQPENRKALLLAIREA
jgi:hypothetical protein